NNPLTSYQTSEILKKMYENENVRIIIIPDIESINLGRNVGYQVNEFTPPKHIETISATEIRRSIKDGSNEWKEKVDEKIHDLITKYLSV
ncbi:MAG: hypothetical protein LC778_20610, partial [Acidobacteria bacterium]|nr:hypothetical protein [Acidobacteriota bacterium]